jgi:hypothetical protein
MFARGDVPLDREFAPELFPIMIIIAAVNVITVLCVIISTHHGMSIEKCPLCEDAMQKKLKNG